MVQAAPLWVFWAMLSMGCGMAYSLICRLLFGFIPALVVFLLTAFIIFISGALCTAAGRADYGADAA